MPAAPALLHIDSGDTANAGVGGLSFATFLLGDVTSFERFVSTSLNAAERQKRWFFYGQDSWRISPKFTMTYGLRWEIYFPESVNGKNNGGFRQPRPGRDSRRRQRPDRFKRQHQQHLEGICAASQFCLSVRSENRTSHRLRPGLRYWRVRFQLRPRGHTKLAGSREPESYGHKLQSAANLRLWRNERPKCGLYPRARPACPSPFPTSSVRLAPDGTLPLRGPEGNVSPRIRPTIQRLPTIDQWNATIQRQITPTLNIYRGLRGQQGHARVCR